MDLHDLINKNKPSEFLWSLIVEPDWVQAGIWTIEGGLAHVVAVSSSVPWEQESDLIEASDTVLSSIVQHLPEGKEPNKVVFGVSALWVEDGQIKKEKLILLREICDKLALKPSGFVTLPEAVSFYIKSKEGAPLNAVMVSPSKEVVEISLFKLGNILGTVQVARSVSLFEDVVEGISRFNQPDIIPSRFILFDGKEKELEEARESLLQGDWQGITKFELMHMPKVEILTPSEKIEAVCLGGASEIANVSSIGVLKHDEVQEMPEEDELTKVGFTSDDVGKTDIQAGAVTNPQKKPKLLLPENIRGVFLGFYKKTDLLVKRILPFVKTGQKPVLFGGGAVLIVVIGLVAIWWFYPKATVTVFIAPQKLEERVQALVDPTAGSLDQEKNILPGRKVSTKESGEKTTSTTGSKLVGDKAKGEVEIQNGTDTKLELKSGTTLIAGNGLEFILAEAVSIEESQSPTEPGVAKASLTAGDIGSEYNLAKDEKFKVGNFPKAEVLAISTGDFTGGSSRQIQAVGEEDRTKLLEELTEELKSRARDNLKTSTSANEFFIDNAITSSVAAQNFSGKTGDESESLKLNMTLDVEGVVVRQEDLFNFAKEEMSAKIPSGYILRESQIEYEFTLKEQEDKNDIKIYELEGNLVANLLPEIDTEKIRDDVIGKYPPLAQEYLSTIPGFVRANINLKPRFPGKLGTLPRVKKNISIEIAAER